MKILLTKILLDKWKNKKNCNETATTIISNERNICMDILRIVSCFFVIVCHTNNWGAERKIVNYKWILSVRNISDIKNSSSYFFYD